MKKKFTHLDIKSNPSMVDVGDKKITARIAIAESRVLLPKSVLMELNGKEIEVPKGPVFQTAILAGIMAAKKTGELIPLCHPLSLDSVKVNIELQKNEAVIKCEVRTTGKTGVEMEALTGASVAALTIYDMCKSFSHDILIRETKLMHKSGGKHEFNRK